MLRAIGRIVTFSPARVVAAHRRKHVERLLAVGRRRHRLVAVLPLLVARAVRHLPGASALLPGCVRIRPSRALACRSSHKKSLHRARVSHVNLLQGHTRMPFCEHDTLDWCVRSPHEDSGASARAKLRSAPAAAPCLKASSSSAERSRFFIPEPRLGPLYLPRAMVARCGCGRLRLRPGGPAKRCAGELAQSADGLGNDNTLAFPLS